MLQLGVVRVLVGQAEPAKMEEIFKYSARKNGKVIDDTATP